MTSSRIKIIKIKGHESTSEEIQVNNAINSTVISTKLPLRCVMLNR